jgi:hypothetical protein
MRRMGRSKTIISIVLIALAIFSLFVFFYLLPIENTSLALDWKGIWLGIRGGKIQYGTGLRNPPWSLLPVLPLGLLPFRISWALISILTILVLIVSVPQNSNRRFLIVGGLLLVTSFPSLQHLADGNLEALVIIGIMLSLYGYNSEKPIPLGIGILLCSAKPQESALFLMVIGIGSLLRWPFRKVCAYIAIVVIVIAPSTFIVGEEWLLAFKGIEHRGSIMDVSLVASMNRLNIPAWIILVSWIALLVVTLRLAFIKGDSFSRIKAGFLISASLLLSPYAAGNSLLTVLAIGTISLLMKNPFAGILLFATTDLQYFIPASIRFPWGATYVTSMLLLNWFVLGIALYRNDDLCISKGLPLDTTPP